jgi:prepilin-type N-terminal cleavage/methylation domain-containing protein/prepilin-type processing-associated H-X9-DG protein
MRAAVVIKKKFHNIYKIPLDIKETWRYHKPCTELYFNRKIAITDYFQGGYMNNISKTNDVSSVRFTLIELLVVIAIIAILAAMLMPALQKARDAAKTSHCISNIGTISKTTMFYQDSFNDFFPWGAYDGSVTYYWSRFDSSSTSANRFKAPLRDFWPADNPSARFACYEKGTAKRFPSRYVCPSTTFENMDFELPDMIAPNIPHKLSSLFFTYAVNMNLINTYDKKPVRMTIVKRPARLLTYADSAGTGLTAYHTRLHPAVSTTNQALSARHNQQASIAYGDGHVALVHYNKIPSYKYDSTSFPYAGPDLNPFAQ